MHNRTPADSLVMDNAGKLSRTPGYCGACYVPLYQAVRPELLRVGRCRPFPFPCAV